MKMKCNKCGEENPPLKKCCQKCGEFLAGETFNNVTGEFGVRNPDGTFSPYTDSRKHIKPKDYFDGAVRQYTNKVE